MTIISVVDAQTGEALPGIPTPRLIQAGGGEAYFVVNPNDNTYDRVAGIWYLRDRDYESPTGEYRRVRIDIKEEPSPGDIR